MHPAEGLCILGEKDYDLVESIVNRDRLIESPRRLFQVHEAIPCLRGKEQIQTHATIGSAVMLHSCRVCTTAPDVLNPEWR
jgi:hypothetical protein